MSRLDGYGSWVRVSIIRKDGGTLLWQAALRPWADPPAYYDGLKKGDLIEIGDVERALSSPQGGSPEVATFSFSVFDRYGYWRALLRDDQTRALTSQDVEYLIASQRAHALSLTPRQGFRGQIKTPRPEAGRRFTVLCESRVGTRYGPWNLDSPLLKRTYAVDDFPGLPRVFENTPVPFLWGEISDAGTVNADGEDIAVGMISPTYTGAEFQGSTPGVPPTSATFLPPPPAFTYDLFGPGGSTTWEYAGVAHVDGGGKTTLGAAVRIDNLPADGAFSDSNGVVLHCAQYPAAQMAQVAGMILYVRRIEHGIAEDWNYLDFGGEVFNTSADTPFQAGPNSNSGGIGYEDNGDDNHHKGGPDPPTTNTAQITGGTPGIDPVSSFYGWFNLFGHLGKITDLFAFDTTTEVDADKKYARVAAADIGDTWTSGKPFLFGSDGTGVTRVINGHTYFGFWGKEGDPRVEAHKSGQALFQVNACGWHEGNLVANPIIDQAAYVYQDVFVQLGGGTNGQGYQTGARLTVPAFPSSPSVPIVQTTTFEAVQQATIRSMGTTKGAIACVYLNTLDITWRSFIEGMNRTFGFDWGESHHGQIMIAMMEDALIVPTMALREFADVRTLDDAGEVRDDEIQNVTPYQFDWAPLKNAFRSGVKTVRRTESIDQYHGEFGADTTLDMIYCRDPQTAVWSAQRQNFNSAFNPQYVEVTCGWHKALNVELGNVITVQHRDIGPDPISVYVRRVRVSQAQRTVSIMGRDRTVILSGVWDALGDETDPDDPNVMILGDEDSSDPYPIGAARLT